MSLSDEPREYLQIPDEVTLQLRVPTGLALAFRRLAAAHKRLGKDEGAAKQTMIDQLNALANT